MGAELCATVHSDDHRLENFPVWFRYPAHYHDKISTAANAFVAAMILPAMCLGRTLRVEGAVSRKMREGAQKFMEIMTKWWPAYKPVEIESAGYSESNQSGQRVGMFFSGGVDSFYTLLKNENSELPLSDKISHLIFVHGFDIRLDDSNLFDMALAGVQATAREYKKEVVPVATNLRQFSDDIIDWRTYHGTAMISVALGIDTLLRRIYIAADHTYENLFPRGSHPLTDPLWATESMDIVHDGCEAGRVEKILWQVGKSQVALDNIRVCWENRLGRYNCGICEKCVRTMLNLEAAGVLERCLAFRGKLRYSDVRNLRVDDIHTRAFAEENYRTLVAAGADPRLIKALRTALSPWSPYRRRKLFHKLEKRLKSALKIRRRKV